MFTSLATYERTDKLWRSYDDDLNVAAITDIN